MAGIFKAAGAVCNVVVTTSEALVVIAENSKDILTNLTESATNGAACLVEYSEEALKAARASNESFNEEEHKKLCSLRRHEEAMEEIKKITAKVTDIDPKDVTKEDILNLEEEYQELINSINN